MKSRDTDRSLIEDPAYAELKDFVIGYTGMAYYANRDEDFSYRVFRRLSKLGIDDCRTYLNLLHEDKKGECELDELIQELTIGETYFFRYEDQFHALRNSVLPDIFHRNQQTRRVRIWSAGCATGPEPYSLAILLQREFSYVISDWDVSIIGTDINREFLARAREGKFREWDLRAVPDDIKTSCFTARDDFWTIKPIYKKWVSFQYHNLIKHQFPSLLNNLTSFDLVLCRNVLIYFKKETHFEIIQKIHQSLNPGGWLLLGHSEGNVDHARYFEVHNVPGTTLYQKSEQKSVEDNNTIFRVHTKWPETAPLPRPAIHEEQTSEDEQRDRKSRNVPESEGVDRPGDGQPDLATVRELANKGAYEKAFSHCKDLLEQAPLNPLLNFYQALISEQIDDLALAEQSLRRTIYLDRSFVLAHYQLGMILQRKGDCAGAKRHFENVLKLLSHRPPDHIFEHGDDVRAEDLRELARMHLEVLQNQ